jgi:hypothetical protein
VTTDQIAAALLLAVIGAVLTAWVRPVIQRSLQQKNELEYLIQELKDIKRHLGENEKVLNHVIEFGKFPATLHLHKLKIPETSAIFSIDTLKLSQFRFSSRLYEIRLKFRNMNIEIDDCVNHCNYDYKYSDFLDIIKYHQKKTVLVSKILADEIKILEIGYSNQSQKSVVLPFIISLPRQLTIHQKAAESRVQKNGAAVKEDESDDSAPSSPQPKIERQDGTEHQVRQDQH